MLADTHVGDPTCLNHLFLIHASSTLGPIFCIFYFTLLRGFFLLQKIAEWNTCWSGFQSEPLGFLKIWVQQMDANNGFPQTSLVCIESKLTPGLRFWREQSCWLACYYFFLSLSFYIEFQATTLGSVVACGGGGSGVRKVSLWSLDSTAGYKSHSWIWQLWWGQNEHI